MPYNIFPFIHFTAFSVFIVLSIFIFSRGTKASLNRMFSVLFVLLAIWSFGLIFVHNTLVNKETAFFFTSFSSIGWIWITNLLIWITVGITKLKVRPIFSFVFTIFFSLIFSYAQWSGNLISDLQKCYFGWGLVYSDSIFVYLWFFYYGLIGVFVSVSLIIYVYTTTDKRIKKQTIIIFISSLVALILGSLIDLIFPFLGLRFFPNIANVISLSWAIGAVYAIIRYRFLDITPALASKSIVDTMSDALIIVNFEGLIIKFNKAAINILKYKTKNFRKIDIKKIFFDQTLYQALFFDKKKKFNNERIYLLDSKGDKIPVVLSSFVLSDKQKNNIGIVLVARDISSLEKKEKDLYHKAGELEDKNKQLEEERSRLNAILQDLNNQKIETQLEQRNLVAIISSFNAPIIFLDPESKIKIINPQAKKVLGFSDNVLGKKISNQDEYSLDNFKKIIKKEYEFNRFFDPARQAYYEEMKIKEGGQEFIYRITSASINDEKDSFIGHIKVFYDYTREKNVEKMKSDFISTAAHKLRTPLSAIKWVMKMVLDGDAGELNSEQKELLGKSYTSNERIIDLVNNLLDASRIDEGKFKFDFQELDITKILQQMFEYAETVAKNKHINLDFNIAKKLPKIFADKNSLSLVIQNLFDNAMKYTPPNGKIKFTAREKGKEIFISVKDNGIGIPEEDKANLFQKFFRASNVIRMQTEGTGLGLYIVKKIVEKHKGKIEIISQEGKGTEVIIKLPIK